MVLDEGDAATMMLNAIGEGEECSLAELFSSPELLPMSIDVEQQSMHFIRMSADAYRDSTFLDARVARVDNYSVNVPLDALIKYRARNSKRPDVAIHLVFHSAFCGSTLLARCFESIPEMLVLKEPSILTGLEIMLPSRFEEGQQRISSWPSAVDVALTLLTRPYPTTRGVLAKLCDICTAAGRDLMEWDTSTTATFLYADLPMFVCQVLKANDRIEWVHNRAEHFSGIDFGYPNLARIADSGLSHAEAAAFLWVTYIMLYRSLRRAVGDRIRSFHAREAFTYSPTLLEWCLNSVGKADERKALLQQVLRGSHATVHSKIPVPFGNTQRRLELRANLAKFSDEINSALKWVSNHFPTLSKVAVDEEDP